MTEYSIFIPFASVRPEQVLPYAAMVQYKEASRLWHGHGHFIEAHQNLAFAAGAGFRVPVGLGVMLMPLSHPYEAALQARSLAAVTGHPLIAGFGPGNKPLQKGLTGAPYSSPLTASREYLTAVRKLLDGEVGTLRGDYITCEAALHAFPAPRVDIGLGVLRPGMARLAGEVADVAITHLVPAAYLRDTIVPALREGAASAGRPVPRLTAIVPLALRRSDRPVTDVVLASNTIHLRASHYGAMLRESGIDVSGGDLADDAEALITGDAFLSGDHDELIGKLAEFTTAGVDEIVLNVTGVRKTYGTRAAVEELKELLARLPK